VAVQFRPPDVRLGAVVAITIAAGLGDPSPADGRGLVTSGNIVPVR
jgi:hypothetical protein